MKARLKLTLNTVSISIIVFSIITFFVFHLFTMELRKRTLNLHKETGYFILSLIDERADILQNADKDVLKDIVTSISGYFDRIEGVKILLFLRDSGKIIYPHYTENNFVNADILSKAKDDFEGSLFLNNKFGYFINYNKLNWALFIFSNNGDVFYYRNLLIYGLLGLFVIYSLSLLFIELRAFKKTLRFFTALEVNIERIIGSRGKIIKKLEGNFISEADVVLKSYNRMLRMIISTNRIIKGKIKTLLQNREDLKSLISLYRKYTDNRFLSKINEKGIVDIVSRRQNVSSLSIELLHFLKPIDGLYPKVITEELTSLYNFVQRCAVKGKGIVNFSYGYFINVIFGAPETYERSLLGAINLSKEILEWVNKRNNSEERLSGIKWNVRMGLSFGSAVTGTIGDDYTVIGEVVEKSKKMLEYAKYYGVPLITDSIDELKDITEILYRKLDLIKEPYRDNIDNAYIYEIFLRKIDMAENAIKLYTHGINMFFEGKYEVAVYDFKKVLKVLGEDHPSSIFLERCDEMMRS